MFCACCRLTNSPGSNRFRAEAAVAAFPEVAAALARRALYKRRTAYSAAPASHPCQIEFIIRGASILTMDPDLGYLPSADLHARDGEIVGIGRDLEANPMLEIDGRGTVALPGFINGHQHICSETLTPTLDRIADTAALLANLPSADAMDIYRVIRLALLDLLSMGVTTVNHCATDIGGDHAETAILAQIDSGVRGRFSYPLDHPPDASDIRSHDTLSRLQRDWFSADWDHLIDLGLSIDRGESIASFSQHGEELGLPVVGHITGAIADGSAALATPVMARVLDLDHCIGTLSPGKRADLILVRDRSSSAHAAISPERSREIIRDVTTTEVMLVAIDGRLRKHNGVLTEPNEGLIRREGHEAATRLRLLASTSGRG